MTDRRIAIVTDSSSQITADLVERFAVDVVPLTVTLPESVMFPAIASTSSVPLTLAPPGLVGPWVVVVPDPSQSLPSSVSTSG